MSFDGFLSDDQPLPESLECKILTIRVILCGAKRNSTRCTQKLTNNLTVCI